MWKRRIILIAILGVVAFGGVRFWAWRQDAQRRQLAAYLSQLNHDDAALRLAAAEGLLRRDPMQDEYRLVRALALIELNRHHEGREQLDVIIERDKSRAPQLIQLQLASYFAEAEVLLSTSDRQAAAAVSERIAALMTGVEKICETQVAKGKPRPFDVLLFDARRFDVLSRAGRFVLDGKQTELTKAKIGDIHQTIESLTLEVAALAKQIQSDDQNVADHCARLMQQQPNHPTPVELMFRYHLRRGELEQARGLARMLAGWKEIPSDVAARMGDALLNLELQQAVAPTDADLELANRLLNHPRQTGKPSIQHELARAELLLQAGDPEQAHALAHEVLEAEWLNARARCIVARAHVEGGDPRAGIAELQKFTELKRDPMVRYTLGLAHLAVGEPLNTSQGQEALRQCLDLEPNHLPARLRLIESLSATGFILEAANDIKVVEQINPKHPRVVALRAAIAIEDQDLGLIASLIEQQLASSATLLRHEDVALVVGMVLDDTARVRRLASEIAATNPNDIFVVLAERWLKKDAVHRARLAPVIVRSLHAFLEIDPLTSPLPPRLPQAGALALNKSAGAPPADRFEPLTKVHFVPRPIDVALESVEIAMDRWPAMPALLAAAAELNIWLGRPTAARQWIKQLPPDFKPAPTSVEALVTLYLDGHFDELKAALTESLAKPNGATPTHRWFDLDAALRAQDSKLIGDALNRMLTAHPWAELPLLMTIADALRRDQSDRVYALLGMAQEINPSLAHLARGRLNLGLGRPADALHDVENVLAGEDAQTDVRRWAAEVRARANLMLDHHPLAVTVFDQLAGSLHEGRIEASIAAVDVLIEFGKPSGAAELLSELMSRADNPSRMTDRMLARAETVMKPSRVRALVDSMLTYRPNDPVLLLYQARAMAHEDDVVAERVVRNVLSKHAKSPRAMMQLADLLRLVQPDESKKIYKELTLRGGRVAEAAQRVLDAMNVRQTPSPTTARREGSPE